MKKVNILLVTPIVLAIAVIGFGCASNLSTPTNVTPEGDQVRLEDLLDEEGPVQSEVEPSNIASTEIPDRRDFRLTQTPSVLERVEIPELELVTADVPPELMEEILADLVARTGAETGDIKVIRGEAKVWNDGSLGCPKPGEFYIQMMISGYWVVLEVEGVEYDYRASDSGHFKLCEGESLSPMTPPDMSDRLKIHW